MVALPSLTMVLGGAASGKSTFAERCVLAESGGSVLNYVATAQAFDDEMGKKVEKHRLARRQDNWATHEEPLKVAALLGDFSAGDIVLLDCATLWLTNQLLAEVDLDAASDALVAALTACKARVVVVTNEVGQGIVPEHAMSRQFREAQGLLNQHIARQAALVVQVVAGLPLVLKGTLPEGIA